LVSPFWVGIIVFAKTTLSYSNPGGIPVVPYSHGITVLYL